MRCRTKWCRGHASKSGHSPKCSKCRTRQWRDNHPITYSYAKLRNRAKERGKTFTLTLEEYTKLWHTSGYGERRGKTAQSLSINRIDNSKGYSAANCEAIPLTYNARYQYADIPDYVREQIRAAEAQLK